MNSSEPELILIGYTLKPYGLFGELKVRPASFDFDRHAELKRVFFRKRNGQEILELEVAGSRADQENWFFKFKDLKTPEAVAHLSGGQLLIALEDRLELPDNMVYVSEVIGMAVLDEKGDTVGKVVEVQESGASELLVVATSKKEIHIPWNDHFVKSIERDAKVVRIDLSLLRDIL